MPGEVWIIGASKGLGLAMAEVFRRRGRSVVGFARRPPADRTLFADFVPLDAADADAFEATLYRMFATRPAPELIIYCAAAVYQGSLVTQPDRSLRAEVEANYLGFVRLCQAVAMLKPAGARVRLVATGSTLGYVGCPSLDNYSACKAALISFARSARRELAGHGVTIQILSPPHMDNGGADLVGPQPFTVAWSAERFVRAAEGGVREPLLGASNRLMLVIARIAPELAQSIMDGIGADALKRGALRMPA
jgi:NAD(P)-dependent dehydrogenase (short-subunit alcohol dehydrogenase family)